MSMKTVELTGEVLGEQLMHAPDLMAPAVVIEPEGSFSPELLRALSIGNAAVVASGFHLVKGAARIDIEPTKTVERRRSAHEVGFGTITDRHRRTRQAIALKPFNRAENALHEVCGYLTLANLGVQTFEPIGVFPSKHGEHFISITKKRNDLTSLDRDKWVVGRQIVDEASAEIAQRNNNTVSAISQLLGYIHSRAIFHPDGQIKNYAKTPYGDIGIIDTEKLIVSDYDDQNAVDHSWRDIEQLIKSLIINTQDREDVDIFGVGMFYGLPLSNVRESIEQLVLVPYLDSLSVQSQDASSDRQVLIDTIYEGVTERFFREEQWPEHFITKSQLIALSDKKSQT